MSSDLITSTMKSDPQRSLLVTSMAGLPSVFACCAWAAEDCATNPPTAPAAAPLRNPRRSTDFFALFFSDLAMISPDRGHYDTCGPPPWRIRGARLLH